MPSSFAVWTSKSWQKSLHNASQRGRGYPHEGPEHSKTAPQEIPRDDQKATLRAGALLRRFGRVLGAAGASRGGPGSPKWMQNKHTIFLKSVSVTVSGSDLVFNAFLIVFGVRRYSKVFKLYCKNAVILNIRIFHSQDMTMQKVFQKTCPNRP